MFLKSCLVVAWTSYFRSVFDGTVFQTNIIQGDGGRWSTFAIQIGTPPQTVRLLPSITTASIFPVWNLACPDATDASLSTANCSTLRGDVFNDKDSSTYQYQKMVQLPIIYEASLYPNGENATYGFDKVTVNTIPPTSASEEPMLTIFYSSATRPGSTIILCPIPQSFPTRVTTSGSALSASIPTSTPMLMTIERPCPV